MQHVKASHIILKSGQGFKQVVGLVLIIGVGAAGAVGITSSATGQEDQTERFLVALEVAVEQTQLVVASAASKTRRSEGLKGPSIASSATTGFGSEAPGVARLEVHSR
ncbi:hypothetical protein OGAPHI_000410 [Ogataea philodendri]|uniref:Uncharacterized protein n=1 Tax=Ogataea philodendri TaxID=1378263 RepID=A0A9P8TAU9_9ASCO|nr:uncharacterized protein OGAPHI_000410 [Ogataea philodendri]KAH3671705.1 hypothetical protein OGAPHI_000410 [Ogataea philodendri]